VLLSLPYSGGLWLHHSQVEIQLCNWHSSWQLLSVVWYLNYLDKVKTIEMVSYCQQIGPIQLWFSFIPCVFTQYCSPTGMTWLTTCTSWRDSRGEAYVSLSINYIHISTTWVSNWKTSHRGRLLKRKAEIWKTGMSAVVKQGLELW
jgi:hypothetical protein